MAIKLEEYHPVGSVVILKPQSELSWGQKEDTFIQKIIKEWEGKVVTVGTAFDMFSGEDRPAARLPNAHYVGMLYATKDSFNLFIDIRREDVIVELP